MKSTAPRLVALDKTTGIPEMLLTGQEITIGRSRQNDLCLDDTTVSRVHAKIRASEGGFTIEDIQSLHGTSVNGKRIEAPYPLSAGDVIQLGIYKLRFLDTNAAPEEQHDTAVANPLHHLRLLLGVTQMISSSLDTDEVLKHVIDGVIQVTQAQRGLLMMINASGKLEVRVARNFDHTPLDIDGLTASTSIPARVQKTGEAIVLSNTVEGSSTASMVALGLRSVMCVPLKSGDRLLGLIYVDSNQQVKGFTRTDLELFESLASQAAVAIEKSRMYAELQQYSTNLEEQVQARTAELVQAERMAAVGRLAASIAHEINSPLGVITSNVDVMRHLIEAPPDKPGIREIAADVSATFATASARLQRIIKAFHVLTGLDQAELKSVDLNDLMQEVLTLLEAETAERITVTTEFEKLQRVICSPGRISQAFMNVLMNAIQSIEGKGSIRIRSEQMEGRVRVTIRDTGKGMTPAQVATAFDPGFNRKEGRVAASLGLMITSQIVKEHRGEIRIESTPGVGTAVIVTLPN